MKKLFFLLAPLVFLFSCSQYRDFSKKKYLDLQGHNEHVLVQTQNNIYRQTVSAGQTGLVQNIDQVVVEPCAETFSSNATVQSAKQRTNKSQVLKQSQKQAEASLIKRAHKIKQATTQPGDGDHSKLWTILFTTLFVIFLLVALFVSAYIGLGALLLELILLLIIWMRGK